MTTKHISHLSGIFVSIIAILAFILSFDAIRQLAIQAGTREEFAWIVPTIIDGAMIVFSTHVLRSTLLGEKTWWGWMLVISFTAVSITFNIAHAQRDWVSWIIAALAPIALFFSFETLMSQIRSTVQRGVNTLANHWQSRARTLLALAKAWRVCARELQGKLEGLQGDYSALMSRADNLQGQVNDLRSLKTEYAKLQKENGRLQDELDTVQDIREAWQNMNKSNQAAARYNAGVFNNLDEAANEAGVSASTISRLAKQMNGVEK